MGEAAQTLCLTVLNISSIIDFGGVPVKQLRDNSLEELDLSGKSLGVPEALVIAALLPTASSLKTVKCATPIHSALRSAIVPAIAPACFFFAPVSETLA